MNREQMLKGFSDSEEKQLFARVLDLAQMAQKRYEPTFSDFFDMAKCNRFMQRLQGGMQNLQVMAYGGGEDCERMMLGFAPETIPLETTDFPLTILRITLRNRKFAQTDLSHRDYLGSILGMGIERGKVGDILLSEEETVFFVHKEIAPYLESGLEKVSKTYVNVEEISSTQLQISKRTERKQIMVSSLRLDAVISDVFHLSRGKAQTLIRGEKVQMNWSQVTTTSQVVKNGDMISLRGFGRFRVGEVTGKTKKDRFVLEIDIYV